MEGESALLDLDHLLKAWLIPLVFDAVFGGWTIAFFNVGDPPQGVI
jgi:hypothetical protein